VTNTAVSYPPNRLERQLERLQDAPAFARPWVRSLVLRRAVPFTGTAGLDFVHMGREWVEIGLKNEKKVQNHIGGIHASAMNLLAETATGMVVGMNVRDDCTPLPKSLTMAFKRRATGAMRAVAMLTPAQQALMRDSDKGEVTVAVTVTDEAGIEPVECEFTWAWIPSGPPKR
jgi:acyl-coenzyme A thioesterase PaaI-like protein